MKSTRMLAVLLAMCLILGLLSACGGSQEASASLPSTAESVEAAPAAEPEAEAAEAPAEEAVPAEEEAPGEGSAAEDVPAEPETEEAAAPGGHKTVQEVAPDIPLDLPLTTEDVHFEYFTTLNPQITGYMSDLSENLYYQTAAERTGVTIDFVLASPDTQRENFQLMIAGGDYTDIIGSEGANYSGGVEKGVDDEVFVNLLDYEEYAPHYFELIRRPEYDYNKLLTDSGYMAGFAIVYTEDQPLNQGWMIRQDWLDEQGLDSPVTLDQLHDVLVNFRDSYDCQPLALTGFSLSSLSPAYDVYGEVSFMGPPMYVDNGEVKFAWTQPAFKDYIQMIHDWYEEGLMDADELVNFAPFPNEDKIVTDKRGVWKVERDNMIYYHDLSSNPDFRAVAIPYPTMNEGEVTHFKELTMNLGTPALFLTTDCEDIPLLVQWVNYRYTAEGATLANYGTEGYTFEYDEDGRPAFTEQVTSNPEGMTSSLAMNVYTLWRCECLYDAYRMDSTFTPDQREAPDIWASNSDGEKTMPSVTLTAEEGEDVSRIYSDLYTYGAENIAKFITGDADMSTYDSFVDTLVSMETGNLEDIYQAAYDRYMSR